MFYTRNNLDSVMIMRLHLDLIDLIRNISSAIDRNESTLGIFLELSKAFDTINHKILSHKLQHYSIRDTALSWIKSYLEDRTQFIQFGWHLTIGKFHVASHRAQSLDLFVISLAWLNLYCLLMRQIYFVPIWIPNTLLLLLAMNLQSCYLA